jgi:hypothetical protein
MCKYFLIILFLSPNLLLAESNDRDMLQQSENKKVICLLEQIERSQAIFVRNGSQHTSRAARKHLERKFKKVIKPSWPFSKKKNFSVQDFIEKLASKSSFSGKPYQMIVNKKTVTTKQWLMMTLKKSCSKPL